MTEMGSNFKNLMVDLPVRYMLAEIEMDSGRLSQQLQRITNMDIMNFYLLAR